MNLCRAQVHYHWSKDYTGASHMTGPKQDIAGSSPFSFCSAAMTCAIVYHFYALPKLLWSYSDVILDEKGIFVPSKTMIEMLCKQTA